MKLRLLLFSECNRSCTGCCNKDWDLDKLPVCTDFSPYSEILLTGGEPLLKPTRVHRVVDSIRETSSSKIYLYTAKTDSVLTFLAMLYYVDGITLTIHEPADIPGAQRVIDSVEKLDVTQKSLRLNSFPPFILHGKAKEQWQLRSPISWIKNAPLPTDEVFMRL